MAAWRGGGPLRFGLRTRVVTFILVVAIPLMAIQVVELGRDLRAARVAARDELAATAQLAAEQHLRALDTGLGVLLAVSRLGGVEALSPGACRGVLAPILEGTPVLANVSAIGRDGRMYCSALPMRGPVDLADREHFRAVLRTGAAATGVAIRTRIGDIPAFPIAYPVKDREGGLIGVAAAVLRTTRLQEGLGALSLPPSLEIVVTDREGTVLTARPRASERVGGPVEPELLAAAREGLRFREQRGADGVLRVHGIAPVVAAEGVAMYAFASLPAAAIDAPIRATFGRILLGFGLVWTVAVVVALILADRYLVRRLRAMGRAAALISRGAFGTRLGVTRARDELDELLMAFDAMAASLDDLRRRNTLVLDSIGDGIIGVDRGCRITFANPAAGRALGVAPEALVGRPFGDAVRGPGAGEGDLTCPVKACMEEGRTQPLTSDTFLRADGSRLQVEHVSTPLVDGARVDGAVIAFRDVTERRALEERLVRGQKLEAVGQLAGGVAHDFNNLLTAIVGCARMLQETLPQGHPGQAEVEEILASSDRATQLTRQLLAFGGRQRLAPRPVDLGEALAGLERMLRRVLEESIALEVRLPRAAAVVVADPGQLEVALLNLAVNARDAMPDGGRLTLALEVVREGRPTDEPGLPPPPRAEIAVRDTGVGMDAGTRERIFEPFFTTKPFGKGTGLGLSTVHGIVSQTGGAVRVHSRPGEGTEFRLFFPLAEAAAARGAAEARPPAPGGRETILLVEDDPALQKVALRTLRGAGYTVVEATRPSEALTLAAERPVDLLLSDVILPETTGIELRRVLTRDRPALPTVLMSGYPGGGEGSEPIPPETPFLAKPFTPEELLGAVRSALDRARAT